MDADEIKVKLSELGRFKILGMSQREIVSNIVITYLQTEEYQELLKSVKIEPEEIKERVMDRLVEEIIKKWREE